MQADVSAPFVLPPDGGRQVSLAALGVRYLVGGDLTGRRFSLVEHPLEPKALGAPTHTHTHEDEISYVVEGVVGVQIGDQVWEAGPGAVIFKPRGIPHAFWNPGDTPARLVEIITPAGFEGYFEEMARLFAEARGGLPDPKRAAAVCAKYSLDLDFSSVPVLSRKYGLAAK